MKFGPRGASVQCIQGTFDTYVIKVILYIQIFDKPVFQKWLVAERNRVKFGPEGRVFGVHMILVKLNASGNSWGHSVYF